MARLTEILRDGEWVEVEFRDMVKGDTFRLTDDDGPVTDFEGNSDFVACCDPYLNEDGIYVVDVQDITELD